MYTIIRKLAMVCLAVVFSALVYGCGGGGKDVAETPDGTDGMVMTDPVDTDLLTAAEEALEAALEELRLANLRLNASDVDLDELADNFMTIPEGVYIIQQDKNMDVGDANFSCSADAANPADPCEVKVDEDGTVTSAGGVATAQNSVAAMNTMTAIALSADTALGMIPPTTAGLMGPPISIGVSRSPDGDTTITLTHVAATDAKYMSGAVDTGHGIAGWMGQTLKRDNSKAADTEEDIDAVPADEMDEATFYTNIDPAKPGKLKLVPVVGVEEIAIAADLMIEDLAEDDTFRAELIRTDGSRIPGTFTCDTDPSCDAVEVQDKLVLGVTVLATMAKVVEQWDFESDNNEKEGETPDADYMYYGYWLKSPVGDSSKDYTFATFSGGKATFADASEVRTIYETGDDANALTATYEGGAAGMYVSRELRLDEEQGLVDEFSPGTYGRFTANAELIAKFGPHLMQGVDMNTDESNTLGGTISEFRDGDVDLGFEVTLERSLITLTGTIPEPADTDAGNVSAMFGGSGPGSGKWSAQFYGPNVDSTSTEREMSSTPTGVAGQFDAVTDNSTTNVGDDTYNYHSRVVGVFAAEKK